MATRTFLCVLANDAVEEGGGYTDIGPNTKRRMNDAIVHSWNVAGSPVTWMFGAGTADNYRDGPTLGYLQEQYLRIHVPLAVCVSNHNDPIFWGTLEEIDWVVDMAQTLLYPDDDLIFMFFTQSGHADRVNLIMSMFHPDVFSVVVGTGHTGDDLTWCSPTELRSYIKLGLIKLGWWKRRYE